MSVYLIDVYSGEKKNITQGYAGHKQVGFDVKVNYNKVVEGGNWVEKKCTQTHEDAYILMVM